MSRLNRERLLVLAVGVLVHGAAVMTVHWRGGRVDAYAFRSLDAGEYFAIAENILSGGVFSSATAAPFTPDTWRTPGYPLFLAVAMLLVGKSAVGLILVQQLVAVAGALLMFEITRRHASHRAAMAVAVLFVLEPYGLYYSFWLMSTTWFVFVLLAAWFAWQRAIERRTVGRGLAFGAIVGFAILVRPVAILVPFVLLATLIFGAVVGRTGAGGDQTATKRVRWRFPVAFAVGVTLVCGAWMGRNWRVAGYWAISDQGGVVLAYFKATEVLLWREARACDRYVETSLSPDDSDKPHRVWETIDEELRTTLDRGDPAAEKTLSWRNLAQGNRSAFDSFEVSRALGRIGRAHLLDDPMATLSCWLIRIGSLLTFPFSLVLRPPHGVAADRLAWLLKSIPYLLLVAWTAWRLFRGRWTMVAHGFPLAVGTALLLASAPQMDPRFRVPVIPFMLVLALLPTRIRRGKCAAGPPEAETEDGAPSI